jgi:hypothetical protein
LSEEEQQATPDVPAREPNALIRRVDALIKRQQDDARRSVEEVPLLTEIVERDAAGARAKAKEDEILAADLERALLVRLVPEINKQISSLRSDMEKELRKSVREAIAHAIAERRDRSGKA